MSETKEGSCILLACDFDKDEWDEWLPLLVAGFPDHSLVKIDSASDAVCEHATLLIAANPPSSLPLLPNVRFVQSLWAGVDKLLQKTVSLPREAVICRMIDPFMLEAMAQTCVYAVLLVHRRFHDYQKQQQDRKWKQLPQTRAKDFHIVIAGGTGQVQVVHLLFFVSNMAFRWEGLVQKRLCN